MILGGEQKHQARKIDGICPCLTSSMGCGGGYVPLIVFAEEDEDGKGKERNEERVSGSGWRRLVRYVFPELEIPKRESHRGGAISNTLDTGCNIGVVVKDSENINDLRIRKLTPKECFRLQGIPDEMYERAAFVNSDSQLYKQAGNACTVNVIYEIARRMEWA